jgi:hypothetical protein
MGSAMRRKSTPGPSMHGMQDVPRGGSIFVLLHHAQQNEHADQDDQYDEQGTQKYQWVVHSKMSQISASIA